MANASGAGSLGAANDTVTIAAPGWAWATAKVALTGVFVATVTWEVSLDDGKNWIAAAYATRLDQVSANPTVAPTAAAVGVYEIPLQANATHVRARCSAFTSGTVNVALANQGSGAGDLVGRPYVPTQEVVAVLYDQTSAINTALDTGVLDMSGWNDVIVWPLTPAGGLAKVLVVDDTGASLLGVAAGAITINASNLYGFSLGLGVGGAISAGATGQGFQSAGPLPKRIEVTAQAVAGLTTRVRIEARR